MKTNFYQQHNTPSPEPLANPFKPTPTAQHDSYTDDCFDIKPPVPLLIITALSLCLLALGIYHLLMCI